MYTKSFTSQHLSPSQWTEAEKHVAARTGIYCEQQREQEHQPECPSHHTGATPATTTTQRTPLLPIDLNNADHASPSARLPRVDDLLHEASSVMDKQLEHLRRKHQSEISTVQV